MDKVTELVARQYMAHAYPHPYDDLAEAAAAGYIDMGDPSIFAPLFWPEGRSSPPRILVAGCGTVQAAMLAYKNPQAQVVGVDLSEASLGHQRFLRKKHGLKNLELYQGDLREACKLGRGFDLIVSSGVLHHLADPGEGLRALEGVLAPGGAMILMVYGAFGRAGVYPMQDAFRRLGLGQTAADIAIVREVLDGLPSTHLVRPFLARTPQLQHDTELVDIFLHPQDVAYSVPELIAWLEANGLALQGWGENHLYYPDAMVPSAIAKHLQGLPDADVWAVTETLHGLSRTHSFVARRPAEARPVSFDGLGFMALRPTPKPGARLETPKGGPARLMVWNLDFELNPAQLGALRRIDGERPIAEIMDNAELRALINGEVEAFARAFFGWLWRIGAVIVRY